jgi:hypothetical protein
MESEITIKIWIVCTYILIFVQGIVVIRQTKEIRRLQELVSLTAKCLAGILRAVKGQGRENQ